MKKQKEIWFSLKNLEKRNIYNKLLMIRRKMKIEFCNKAISQELN
jgi:hypothetical protein